MKPLRIWSMLLSILLAVGLTAGSALAQDKAELQKRAEARYPKLLEAKRAGLIGETAQGFVEAVEGKDLDGQTGALVDEENGDRRELYKILAKETNTDEATVAQRAATRNLEKARPGEWIKRGDRWEQKK